jgi:hypothetical protein
MITGVIAFTVGMITGIIIGLLFGRHNAKIADKLNEVGKDVINKVVK